MKKVTFKNMTSQHTSTLFLSKTHLPRRDQGKQGERVNSKVRKRGISSLSQTSDENILNE
jgi:hypothetical protein